MLFKYEKQGEKMYIKEIIEILKEINPYIEIDENTELIESEILDSLSIQTIFLLTFSSSSFAAFAPTR